MTTRIDADLVIPGRGDPIERGSVVLDGPDNRLRRAPTASAPAADGDPVEVPVVLPGLWEVHGHFVGTQTPDLVEEVRTPLTRRAAVAARDIEATMLGGVTSVREVGGLGLELAPAIDSGPAPRPDDLRRRPRPLHDRRPR